MHWGSVGHRTNAFYASPARGVMTPWVLATSPAARTPYTMKICQQIQRMHMSVGAAVALPWANFLLGQV